MQTVPDSMSLASSLKQLADSLNPDNQGETEMAEAAETTETAKKVAKKVAKKPAANGAAKKAGPPKRELPTGHTSLNDLCKKAKVEPVAARRRLRAAGIERKEGSQYSWPAGQHDKILKIIKGDTE